MNYSEYLESLLLASPIRPLQINSNVFFLETYSDNYLKFIYSVDFYPYYVMMAILPNHILNSRNLIITRDNVIMFGYYTLTTVKRKEPLVFILWHKEFDATVNMNALPIWNLVSDAKKIIESKKILSEEMKDFMKVLLNKVPTSFISVSHNAVIVVEDVRIMNFHVTVSIPFIESPGLHNVLMEIPRFGTIKSPSGFLSEYVLDYNLFRFVPGFDVIEEGMYTLYYAPDYSLALLRYYMPALFEIVPSKQSILEALQCRG